jgi:hypothetical protein
MNSSVHIMLLYIALLICFIVNNFMNNRDNFEQSLGTDSTWAPVGTYGINSNIKPIGINQYANQIAYQLENPFGNPSINSVSKSKAPWNPVSYRDLMEPDGQIVGVISPN